MIREQMLEIISKANLNGLSIREKITGKIRRYRRFAVDVLNQQSVDVKASDLDIRRYVQHLFTSGQSEERRELLEEVKKVIIIGHGKLSIVKPFMLK